MLTAHAQTLLRIRYASVFGHFVSQKEILELIHARIGEQERGIVLHHDRGGRDNGMSFRREKV
jgi:hypothetical protein